MPTTSKRTPTLLGQQTTGGLVVVVIAVAATVVVVVGLLLYIQALGGARGTPHDHYGNQQQGYKNGQQVNRRWPVVYLVFQARICFGSKGRGLALV